MLSVQELRSSTNKELLQELEKAKKEALKVKINVKTKQEKDSSKALKTKRYVAQILTVMRELDKEEKSKSSNAKKVKSEKEEENQEKSKDTKS